MADFGFDGRRLDVDRLWQTQSQAKGVGCVRSESLNSLDDAEVGLFCQTRIFVDRRQVLSKYF